MGLAGIAAKVTRRGPKADGAADANDIVDAEADDVIPAGVELRVMTAVMSRHSRGARSLLGFLTRRFKRAWPEVMTVSRKWKFSTGPKISLGLRIENFHYEIRLVGEELVATVGNVIDGKVPRTESLPIGSWAARLAIKLVEMSPTSPEARHLLRRLAK